ncbi:MAG: Smr/MutS family protein [Flavobacteriales bacterium]|nr:Smr/MutS family protein [Flavobacteriales bacterium]
MAAQMRFRPGDRVSFVDEVGGGVVLEVFGRDRLRLRSDDGFEMEVPTRGLVLREREQERALHAISDRHAGLRAADDRLADRQHRRNKVTPAGDAMDRGVPLRESSDTMEVDLHLEELLDDHRRMSDGEKLEYQIRYFERMLNTAIREKKRRMIVIHGVGEGVLREEVRKVLAYYEHVRFDDADPRRYGSGATEVWLPGSH